MSELSEVQSTKDIAVVGLQLHFFGQRGGALLFLCAIPVS